eukprot:1158645-Pelagomonas_calceolata.AAC.4
MPCWTRCSPGAAIKVSKAMTVACSHLMSAPAFKAGGVLPLAPLKLGLYLVLSSQIHTLFKITVELATGFALGGQS